MTIHVEPLTAGELVDLTPPDERAGLGALATERGNLPLDEIEVRSRIVGLSAETRLSQSFINPHPQPLEATYIFPLPDRAGVTAMRMEAGDRVIEGVLKERQQARQEYDRAIEAGRRASIAEEERPEVFTMRVGNIMPGERVVVRLTLAGALPYEDGAATYRFPLVVAPRYIPGEPIDGSVGDGVQPDTDATPDASRITPPVLLPGFPNPVRLAIQVDIDPAGLPLRGVRSSLHQVAVTERDGVTSVRAQPGERANRDFVLRLDLADEAAAVAQSLVLTPDTSEDTGGVFQVTLLPPAPRDRGTPRDVVLVLDRSGSMGGWKMVAARRAAARVVDTLSSADRFAVLAFDNVVERPPGSEGLAEASDRRRFRAVEFLAGLHARGGTEMLRPLADALRLLADPERDKVLVLVTDGQVGNEDQILRELHGSLEAVRVHTVGIDQAVNAGFLGRLAATGGGRCELVESEDRLDEAMTRIHRRIAAPLVTGLQLAAEGLDIDSDSISPARAPDLFAAAPLRIMGRYRGPSRGAVTVRGRRSDGTPWSAHITASTSDNPAQAKVWARSRLRDLEDRYTAMGAGAGVGLGASQDERQALEHAIVRTSLRFGVLCRFTAYVAVDSRAVAEGGEPHRVTQPVEAPAGWQMMSAVTPLSFGASSSVGGMAAGDAGMGTGGAGIGTASASFAPAAPGTTRPRAGRGAGKHGAPVRPGGRVDPLAEARTQVRSELRRLSGLAGASAWTRRDALADLGSRLGSLARHLDQAGVAAAEWESLTELVAALAVCDGPAPVSGEDLERLWLRAIDVLKTFSGSPETFRGDRAVFWKRR